MRAADVMTSEVISVGGDASVKDAAKLMADHGISAVPVVDRENRVIGMVSEGDLLHRAEPAPNGAGRGGSTWWHRLTGWLPNTSNRIAGKSERS